MKIRNLYAIVVYMIVFQILVNVAGMHLCFAFSYGFLLFHFYNIAKVYFSEYDLISRIKHLLKEL